MDMKREDQEKTLLFIFFLAVLFFTRLYALFKVGGLFYHFEGLWRGWMAKEMLEGAGWSSIFNNPYFFAEGSSVVIGYMAALSFSILGDNFLALIFVPLLFNLLIFAAFYLFLVRYFSRNAAIIFSFLFIFPPASFLYISLYALGFHFESILFSILGLFCFFEIFFNEANYKAYLENKFKLNLLFITFGVISGFGIYFFYDYLIMLFTIFLFWFIFDRIFFLKKIFLYFLLGLAVGFTPWLIYNTTHNFKGLHIHGLSLLEIMFSKNMGQIVKTFVHILTQSFPGNLQSNLYLTIILSFLLLFFFNRFFLKQLFKNIFSIQAKYIRNIKELILISYIFIFIIIWSILYLPLWPDDISGGIGGLWGRIFHSFPFLFVIVALCFDRFISTKNDKNIFLKIAIPLVLISWVLRIGFANYTHIISMPIAKINPLKIKGYSIRVNYLRGQGKERRCSFLTQDMGRLIYAARHDERLWQAFSSNIPSNTIFYQSNSMLQALMRDSNIDNTHRPYYYLLIGLNTGDLMEDYDISGLNQLVVQKVPDKYRHYFYEGLSIALMNRRYNELMENIGFIDMVPSEYRHYFLFGLGRAIGAHFDGKIREEKLEYAIKRFSPVFEDYVYHGLVTSLIAEKFLKDPKETIKTIKEKYLPYLYRTIAVYFFDNLPLENDVSRWVMKFGINKDNEKYFYYGAVEAFFKNDNNYREKDVKTKIEKIIACNWARKDYLYEGLGLSLGHLTFGYINRYAEFIEPLLNNDELAEFYKGYCLSLKERYGRDIGKIKELIDDNVREKFRKNL